VEGCVPEPIHRFSPTKGEINRIGDVYIYWDTPTGTYAGLGIPQRSYAHRGSSGST
jgi:hypothetical protein